MTSVSAELSVTRSRIVALGVLLAVLFLAVFMLNAVLFAPLAAKYEELSAMEERVLRVQAVLSAADGSRANLLDMRQSVLVHSGFFTQQSDSIALSALQDRMQQIVLHHGGVVNSFSSGQSQLETGDIVELNIRLSFAISHAGLVDLLAEIQNERDDVFVSSLSIQSHQRNQDDSRDLTVRLVAVALYLPNGGAVQDG